MTHANCQDILREIARRMGSKVSSCEQYDPNVCSYEPDPRNIAKIVTITGQPFLKKTSYTKEGQKIRLYANNDFFQIRMSFEFDIEPMSINRADEIYFFNPAVELRVRSESYQIFSNHGILSKSQKTLLGDVAFQQFVEGLRPACEDSIHFYRNGISIYLRRPDVDRALHVIDLTRVFLGGVLPSPSETNFTGLPPQFKPLIPLIQAWAISDDVERDERRARMSRVVLQALVDEVRPYFGAINSYLDSFRELPQPEAATALGALAEFVAETDLYLREKR